MDKTIAVVGLGYVGLPILTAFAAHRKVIGFDLNARRIAELQQGIDSTGEVNESALKSKNLQLSTDPNCLSEAQIYIVAVPTPINNAKQPDLSLLASASQILATYLGKDDIVVYESTVYPGVTEDYCLPILEHHSNLLGGKDFYVGYSPERVNPGDPEHSFSKLVKIVSGQTEAVRDELAELYQSVIDVPVHKASSIRVAESAKVIENAQRDINIAFMNELSMIFDRLDIPTHEVLEAARTKWNFLDFKPGLVGGHCIGVDPYYLAHLSQSIGLNPEIILAGRRTNDEMPKFTAQKIIKKILASGMPINGQTIGICGFTFKENCPDVRNTGVFKMVEELRSFNLDVMVHDPIADRKEVLDQYGIELVSLDMLSQLSCAVLAVPHNEYLRGNSSELMGEMDLVFDLKDALKHMSLKNVVVL